MKKFLLLYALAVTLSLAGVLRRYRTETHRLEQNQRALLSQVERYRTRAGEAAASAEVLQLRCREFERLRAGDAERIRQLGIRLRRVEAAATLATATEIDVQVPLHDTIARRDFAAVCDSGRLAAAVRFDTVRSFRWRDPWVTVEGHIRGDSADCRVESVDTLRQVVHRVPRPRLFVSLSTINPQRGMKTAIFPGSFDPFTRGHEAIVEKALHLFDKVIIGIGSNVAKQGLLSVENRKRLIDDYYAGDARVEAMIYGGMTGDFAQQVGAAAVIRGVRNTTDFEYERTMAATNRRLYPAVVTVMLFTPPDVADISSSTVREVLAFGRSVAEFLPRGIELENYL